jgi:hypothetical protein
MTTTLEDLIRGVVEAHESLCLDVDEERERLITDLLTELSDHYAPLSDS